MYPIERYMKTLKQHVRNMARPKASIVEGYIQEGNVCEVLDGTSTKFLMSSSLCDVAHQYVLANISIMTPWMQ
jgi:hypothetical protein